MASRKVPSRKKKKRKIILFIIEMAVLAVVLVFLYWYLKVSKINVEEVGEVQVNELDEVTKETLSGYTDIAIFGLDNRSNGELDSGRSDMIMIASINNDSDDIKLVSVYRDTYLNMTDDTYSKVTHAYSYGGAKQAMEVLNQNLDMDIQSFVSVDFDAVAKVIDAIGGVEIDISEEELPLINGYIQETAEVTGIDTPFLTDVGPQQLTGVQAVSYARIRYTAGGDFQRAARQREVISKVLQKVKGSDLGTISNVMDELFPSIYTNIPLSSMLSLAKEAMSYELSNTEGFPYSLTTKDMGSAGDCVIPADLATNVIQLHSQLYGAESYTPSETVQRISSDIETKTGVGAQDGYEATYTQE